MRKVISVLLSVLIVIGVLTAAPVSAGAADTARSEEVGAIDTSRYIYFANTFNWDEVWFYAWNTSTGKTNEEWPGKKMAKTTAKMYQDGAVDVYRIKLGIEPTGIIFNNNNGSQTEDIPFQENVEGYLLTHAGSGRYHAEPCTFQDPHGTTGACTWQLSGTALTISGSGAMADYTTSNPSPWGTNITSVTIGANVTYIGDNSFKNCTKLTQATIGNAVTIISVGSFSGCTSLASVNIPAAAQTIQNGAFQNCTALTSVLFHTGLKRIDENAFSGCTNLSQITFPETLTFIGENAFADTAWYNNQPDGFVCVNDVCYSYKGVCPATVVIPAGAKYLSGGLFHRSETLNSVTIGDDVLTIYEDAFERLYNLTKVIFNNDHCFIDRFAFKWTSDMTFYCRENSTAHTFAVDSRIPYVIVGDSGDVMWSRDNTTLTVSGTGAMANYASSAAAPFAAEITSIVIEEGVTAIGNYAFADLPNLTSVTLPSTLTRIGDHAFENCTSLATLPDMSAVTYLGKNALDNTAWMNAQENGMIYAGDIFVTCKGTCPALYRIQSDIRVVAAGAFSGSTTLEQIGISEGVIYINDDAFKDCPNLIAASFGHQHVFGNGAFLNCPRLVFYGPRRSPAYTYAADHNITYSIMVEESGDCEWVLHAGRLIISGEGAMADYASAADTPYSAGVTSIIVEEGVTSIGDYAFANLPDLTSVTLPSTLTRIGDHAFENCPSLADFPAIDNVTYLGKNALDNTGWLNSQANGYVYVSDILYTYKGNCPGSIVIPGEVRGIAAGALAGKSNITEVTISNDVEFINKDAFRNCPALTNVTFLTESCTIEEGAFLGAASNLTFLCIDGTPPAAYGRAHGFNINANRGYSGDTQWDMTGQTLTVKYGGAMEDYATPADSPMRTSITKIIVNNSVTKIGANTFARLTALDTVILPDTLIELPDSAFPTGHFTAWVRRGSLAEQVLQNKSNVTLQYLNPMGDINGDGKVNVRDVTALQRSLADLEPMNDLQIACADVNGDGVEPSVQDVTVLQRYLAEFAVTLGTAA